MISIIIPVFNGAEWLGEAIESAIWECGSITDESEIIIVNDGSTDNSLEVAKQYPVRIINQTNRGLASARNTGILNTKYDWILPLDADDKLMTGCLVRIKKYIIQDLYDIIAPSFREFGLGNREVILQTPKLEDFKTGNRLGYCASIRRSALLEVGGYSPKMVEGYEDLHLWINLLTRGYKLITIPEVLWEYRIKSESMYTRAKDYHLDLLAQINKDFPNANLNF